MLNETDQDMLLDLMTRQLDTPVRVLVEKINGSLRRDI